MSSDDLKEAISIFEMVVQSSRQLCKAGGPVTRALSELYLTKSAYAVRTCVGASDSTKAETADEEVTRESDLFAALEIPDPGTIHGAGEELVSTFNSGDKAGIESALERMGITALCSALGSKLSRFEIAARSIPGRAQLIPLIELAIFAFELGDYKTANALVADAMGFGPGPSELHDLCSIKGLIALREGNKADAIRCLRESSQACMADEFACLECSIRAPNLLLAEELLAYGERDEILEYLTQCRDVWDAHKRHFSTWIDVIEAGQRPDFRPDGILAAMSHPALKLQNLCTSARLLEDRPRPSVSKTKAEVMAGRERLRAGYKQTMGAAIKGRLETNNN